MLIKFFIKGVLFGFSMAAPVGPISLLCINRTLLNGWIYGVASGLGAAFVDLFYALVAVLGLTVVSDFLISYQNFFRFLGGMFLFYLGVRIFLSKSKKLSVTLGVNSLWNNFITTLFLTLINPMTVLCYVAVFSSFGVNFALGSYTEGLIFAFGAFTGAVLFYLIICSIVAFSRDFLNDYGLMIVNKISGILISLFGSWLFFELAKNLLSLV